MSSHYSYYEKIDGKLAFLSGNISALSDECLCNIIPKYWAVEADVFKADSNDICDSMRRSFANLLGDDGDKKTLDNISKFSFALRQLDKDVYSAIYDVFSRTKEKHIENEKEMIDEFMRGVRFQLGELKNIYKIEGELNERITRVISEFYTYLVFDLVFFEYEEYMVMIVFGSDE